MSFIPKRVDHGEEPGSHWIKPHVPEFRIDEQAIDHVAELLKMKKVWVERIHNFQWKTISQSTETVKSINVKGFFKISVNDLKIFGKIKPVIELKEKLQEKINDIPDESQVADKIERYIVKRKVKTLKEKMKILDDRIENYNSQMKK